MKRFGLFPALLTVLLICSVALTGCPPGALRAGATRTFDGIKFQWCPPGTFAMGSPNGEEGHDTDEALHEVTLSEGFWLSTYEITQAQWEDVMGTNPSLYSGADKPVEMVSWDDVHDFLVVLNASSASGVYRLPTEAEWEYAYRAETTTRFFWGNDPNESKIGNYSWYDGNSGSSTRKVGQKLPNPWGLHDIAGNVSEWCEDTIGDYPAGPVTDPQGPSPGNAKVLRGGYWDSDPSYHRAADRDNYFSDERQGYIGFRLVRTAD